MQNRNTDDLLKVTGCIEKAKWREFASLTIQTKKLKVTGAHMRKYSFQYSPVRLLRTIQTINHIPVALFTLRTHIQR
jgi:hypothetical protein